MQPSQVHEDKIIQLKTIVKGHVQGIGFRWTSHHIAIRLGVSGTVRNLPDGSVEIISQGNKNLLQTFLNTIKEEIGTNHITTMESSLTTPEMHLDGFRIIH